MRIEVFESQGFAIAESVINPEQLASVEAELNAMPLGTAGTRNLLLRSWCRALVGSLRSHPVIGFLVPAHAVAVQCTLGTGPGDR